MCPVQGNHLHKLFQVLHNHSCTRCCMCLRLVGIVSCFMLCVIAHTHVKITVVHMHKEVRELRSGDLAVRTDA